ncbi:amidohydrolase family protein [Clostridium sp.]|jgi:N-acyl-D-amino-acid deacylase|uniref:N-acyl-D-amino-acid deacylase family protein n=1 Tax=Clostridium sp. TaxID=1506 RepID=UPI002586EDCB|nr:amidohydrolase family protein [Clostridium sp.]MDF2502717.1 N-acyl-D-aspartate/D-glutamate deacylase [Clostridium sp.]
MNIYDLVIKNGNIVDVEQESIEKGNIAIIGNKIAKITNENICGNIEIDATGLIVSPGFIDIHGHIDGSVPCGKLAVLQGVTTTVGGNCGGGPLDIKKFFDEQDSRGFIINQAQLIGHSFTLRETVGITDPYVAATKEQIKEMADLLRKSFQSGAIGLSFGIEYAPGSSKDEIMTLSSIAEKYGKVIAIHTNVNLPNDLTSLEDAIEISEKTGAHVLVSHFVYQYGTGIMTEALDMLDKARARGLKVSADSGMYSAFSTFIGSTIYDEEYMKRFGWKFEDLLVATGKYKGKRLTRETYDELRKYHKDDNVICFTGIKEEIYEALSKEYIVLSSDIGPSPTGLTSEGHPQNAGTFPRFFRKMVREGKNLSLIKAVEKCTLFPANMLGLSNKGRMKVGADADIVIFDIDTIGDKAQFPDVGEPDAKPEGIPYVIVNGKIVVNNGDIILDSMSGKCIRDLPACTIW